MTHHPLAYVALALICLIVLVAFFARRSAKQQQVSDQDVGILPPTEAELKQLYPDWPTSAARTHEAMRD